VFRLREGLHSILGRRSKSALSLFGDVCGHFFFLPYNASFLSRKTFPFRPFSQCLLQTQTFFLGKELSSLFFPSICRRPFLFPDTHLTGHSPPAQESPPEERRENAFFFHGFQEFFDFPFLFLFQGSISQIRREPFFKRMAPPSS